MLGLAGDVHINQWMMLASARTIAVNLTILGAASNIIIINAAESRGSTIAYTYAEFFKIGVIVTIANIGVYYLFLTKNLNSFNTLIGKVVGYKS
jgi:Na+/H+ antiporter NhaD/arsenite permease-like protein